MSTYLVFDFWADLDSEMPITVIIRVLVLWDMTLSLDRWFPMYEGWYYLQVQGPSSPR